MITLHLVPQTCPVLSSMFLKLFPPSGRCFPNLTNEQNHKGKFKKEMPRPNLSHPDSMKTGVGLIKRYVGILFNRFRNHEIQPIPCPRLNKTHKSLPPHKIPAGRGLPFLQVPVVFDL